MKNLIGLLSVFIVLLLSCGGNEESRKSQTKEKINTPPFIESVEILPEHPKLGSRVLLRIKAGDKEGDKINFSVQWFLNDTKIGEGIEFYLDRAKRGDKIYAEVTPDDGKRRGETVRTKTIEVGNTPPKITNATITPDTVLVSTPNLTVNGEGYDPDGDSISWLCYWVLDYSERLPDSSTTLNLKNLKLKKGSHIIAELYAFDGDTVSTPYLLQIDVVNAHPILARNIDSIPYKPDSIYFPLPIIDPDGDPITFELLSAPEGLKIDKDRGVIYGSVEDTSSLEVMVRATDSDGAFLEARFTLTSPAPSKSSE